VGFGTDPRGGIRLKKAANR